jgi:molecular chaperone GrpE
MLTDVFPGRTRAFARSRLFQPHSPLHLSPLSSPLHFSQLRYFYVSNPVFDEPQSKPKTEAEQGGEGAEKKQAEPEKKLGAEAENKSAEETKELSPEQREIAAKDAEIKKLKETNDKLLRAVAELQNQSNSLRKDIDNAKQYGITGFSKSLLEVADSLEMAVNAVKDQAASSKEGPLRILYDGVELTHKNLIKALDRHGVKQFESLGQKFDPNFHEGLYFYPDESKEPNTVGAVLKVGYKIHDRVLRPAQVGTVKPRDKPADKPASGSEQSQQAQ